MSENLMIDLPFIDWLHPSLLLIVGALFIPLFKGVVQQSYRVLLAVLFAAAIFGTAHGTHGVFQFLGFELTLGRADQLALVFGYVFGIMAIIGSIYSLHLKDNVQHVAAFIYAGSAVGVVFAGDLLTLYVFWEMMLFSSVWLIWRRKNPVSFAAGFRYLLVHAVSGVLLLGGIILYYMQTGSFAFEQIEVGGPAFWLILIGFMINAAVPPLHAWLTDAYPEATITGAIFLSAFTTKTAVYTLIRGYPGTEFLVWLGAIMALWGVVYAVLANDIRRLLAYHIISQVGYMVAGVGMGTIIALNGTASHAFTHILYKSLLFMGAGAVIYMTGRAKLTELGGIYRWMPITFLLYMVGAFSISAFPLFSGFVSKTMVVEAAAVDGRAAIWLMLSLASAGTFLHTGLKLPWFTFMGKDSGLRPKEAPWNMLFAMGIAAFFCIFIGVHPQWLYQFLPGPVDYNAYTAGHVFWELQLLLFTGLGFFLLLKHVGGEAKISVDTDWVYRVAFPRTVKFVGHHGTVIWHAFLASLRWPMDRVVEAASRHHGPQGALARTWPTGSMVLWVAVLLAASLLIYYL
ncbi:Na(+)/H(+) antiporter subunit D [Natronospira bacteriovora]|uniref:Na(+)/H(+) antiporter subunit D n=1 Tax=Natronospira bacteriovora TaxID=3069753 RepID=A0ABU0W4L1_9GAMM|nr:Na(+)/H(+) antiporter subunit D [Natronospira sp. AB-CW4]MDQ2068958.1 Na(+)/H(+) antiporter subunit D [Natronospira sp. AB-CW4]